MNIDKLKKIRRNLHQHPETSGNERKTAEKIVSELENCKPDSLIKNIGGEGVLAKFSSKNSNPAQTILFRAELDAIAVQEESDIPHRSEYENIMHGCGHDGHMVILLGLAEYLHQNRPANVDVYLLFQPAEETGEGAGRVLNDDKFKSTGIDYAFALHNLPGFEEGSIVIKDGLFAAASTGIEITFKGSSSHAAYPEQGNNPSQTMAETILKLDEIFNSFRARGELNIAVNTYIKLGEPAFGINPGTGRIGYTIRSGEDDELDKAVNSIENYIEEVLSKSFNGDVEYRRVEPFTATVNDEFATNQIRKSAQNNGSEIYELQSAFPWSEDFGGFRTKCRLGIFGLGAGKNSPHLHSEYYDFNDNIIQTGIDMFTGIVEQFSDS